MATTVTRQDSLFYTHRLGNGLQLLGQRIPGVESAATVFWVLTGTRDEQPEELGVSHFLEHMAFRRTKHYVGEQIDRAFEEMGADHNAGTWLEMTFYWARVLGENLSWAIDVLAELVQPVLDEADFEQERPVILEEIARYEDLPTQVLLKEFMQDFYGAHPLSRDTLGTPETIKSLTVERMREYWRSRYGTHNMIFAVAGNFDWDEVVAQLETLTAGWNKGRVGRSLAPARFQPAIRLSRREKFTQQQLAIGVPAVNRRDPRYFTATVLSTILGDNTGSRLYWALQQSGLAETATSQVMEFDDNGMMFVHVSTEPSLAQRALETARREMQRLQDFDIGGDELDRAKAKLTSSVIIGGESTNERVMSLIRSWLAEGRLETLEELRAKIEAVSLEDLRAFVRDFPLAPDQVIYGVGPLSEADLTIAP